MFSSLDLEMQKLHLELPCWSIRALHDDAPLTELHLDHLSCFLCIGSELGELGERKHKASPKRGMGLKIVMFQF